MMSASEAPANVRVLVRVRPLSEAERTTSSGASGRLGVLTVDGGGRGASVPVDFGNGESNGGRATVTVNDAGGGAGGYDSDNRGSSTSSSSVGGKAFMFDAVHGPRSTQSDVFESLKGIVDSVASGYNGTVVAYGQTGSGKTHTVFGSGGCESESGGLVQRSLKALFRSIAMSQAQDASEGCSGGDTLLEESFEGDNDGIRKTTARASFFEIFNERVFDLLHGESLETALPVREDSVRGVYVDGLQEVEVNDTAEAESILARGNANRQMASTSMNRTSSRSHAVFVLTIKSVFTNGEGLSTVRTSKFTLVDLAGSERQKSTNAVGDRLKEASSINTSLLTLGNVINALVDKEVGRERHVPFRDSKLTFLLRDSWGGNSKTCLVATVSPSASSVSETLSTLKFAQRAKLIKNTAVLNEDTCGTVAALQAEVTRLRSQLEHYAEPRDPPAAVQLSLPNRPSCSSSDDGICILNIVERRARRAEGKVSMLESQLSRKEVVVKSLKRKLQEEHLVRKLKQRRIEYLSRKADGTEDINEEIISLRGEVDLLRRQIEAPSLDAVELKVECELVKKELEKRTGDGPEKLVQHERESLEGIIDELTDEKHSLKKKLVEISNNSSETNKEIEAVLEEVGRLETEMESQKIQLKSREEEVWVANERVSTAEAKCDELHSELVATKEEVSRAMSESARLRKCTDELQMTTERLTGEIEEKNMIIVDIEATHAKTQDELESKINELSKRLEESQLASDDKIAELEVREQLAAASKDNSILVQRIQEAAADLDKQKVMIQRVQQEKSEAIGQMESKLKIVETALEAKVQGLEEEKHGLLLDVENRERASEEARKKAEATATTEIKNLKAAIIEIEQQFQTVQEDKTAVIEEMQKLAKEKETSLQAKVQILEEEKQTLESRLALLKAETEEATSTLRATLVDRNETRVAELEATIRSLEKKNEQSVEDALKGLEDVKESFGATIKSLEEDKGVLLEQAKALKKAAEEAKTKNAAFVEELNVRDETWKEVQGTINDLEQKIQSLQEENDRAVADGLNNVEEAKELKAERDKLTNQIETMKIEAEEARAKAEAEFAKERSLCEQAVKSMEERISSVVGAKEDAVKEALDELNMTKSFLEAKVQSLEGEKCDLSQQLVARQIILVEARANADIMSAAAAVELDAMRTTVKEVQEKIDLMQEEKKQSIDRERKENEIGEAKSKAAVARIKTLEEENAQLAQQIAALQAFLDESNLSADAASLEATSELDKLKATLFEMQACLTGKDKELESARVNLQAAVDAKDKEIHQTFEAMEGEFKHQINMPKEMKEKIASVEDEKERVMCNLQTKVITLEAERQTMSEQAALWELAADDAKKRARGFSDKLKLVHRAKSSLEFELDTLREDQDTLTEQVRCLHERNDEIEQENARLSKLLHDGGKPAENGSDLAPSPNFSDLIGPAPQPNATPFRDLSSRMDVVLNRMSEAKSEVKRLTESADDSFDEDMFLPNAEVAESSSCTKELSFFGHIDNAGGSDETTNKENVTPFRTQFNMKESATPGKTESARLKLPFSERKKDKSKTPSAVKTYPKVMSETKVRTGWSSNLKMM